MADSVKIRVRRLPAASDLPLPQVASAQSSGFDLRAAVEDRAAIAPRSRMSVPTGLIFEIPSGWEGQVRPRSGLAADHGVTLVNSPGTIDSDYRGEVRVLLINLGEVTFELERGDRIAQIVFAAVAPVVLEEVETVRDTARGTGGFGSSGVS